MVNRRDWSTIGGLGGLQSLISPTFVGYDVKLLKEFHYFQSLDLYENLVAHLEMCLICRATIRTLKYRKSIDQHFKMAESLRILIALFNGSHAQHASSSFIAQFECGFNEYLTAQLDESIVERYRIIPNSSTVEESVSGNREISTLYQKSKSSQRGLFDFDQLAKTVTTGSNLAIKLTLEHSSLQLADCSQYVWAKMKKNFFTVKGIGTKAVCQNFNPWYSI